MEDYVSVMVKHPLVLEKRDAAGMVHEFVTVVQESQIFCQITSVNASPSSVRGRSSCVVVQGAA